MARAYSLDLRERVVAAVAEGSSCRQVASLFKVSVASVVKWSQRFRMTGSAAAYKVGGRRPYALQGERDWLLARLAAKPDITLRAVTAELAERGIQVSCFAVWHFFAHEGISFKKSLHASEQDRPDVARRRAQWKRYQGRIDPGRLVFIDETWAKTNMTRRYGRCRRGERLVAKVPHGRWRTLTFLAALRTDRITAPWVLDGPINGECFQTYVEQVLLPTLTPGDIVIIDNLGSHKGATIRRTLRAVGVKLFFLPPYSPDLNPIEQVFAKLKTLLRKAAERSVEATWKRIGQILTTFTPAECANYLANAGYASK
jgi:transposase